MGLEWVVLEMYPAVVPCATADEESGSSLKTWILCGSTLCVTRNKKSGFGKCFLSNKPLHKILLSANQTLALSLIYPVHYTLFIPPPWVWLDLLSTFCTHPILYFYRGRSRLCARRRWVGVPSCTQPCLWIWVTRRRYRMAQDSEDLLFIFNIVACVWIVILAIVALLCSLTRRVVRQWTIWCNKYVINLLGLMFVSHLSLLLWGDASTSHELKHNNKFCQI